MPNNYKAQTCSALAVRGQDRDTRNMVDAAAVIRYYCYCCAPYPKEGGRERESSGLLLRGIGTLARPWDLAKVGCRVGGLPYFLALLRNLGGEVSRRWGQNSRDVVREEG